MYKRLWPFVLLFLLGFLIRVVWIYKIPNTPESDFLGYYLIAKEFYAHNSITLNGHYVAFQGPGYPLFLGLFMKLLGSTSLIVAKWFNVLLSTLNLVIFYALFNKLFAKKWVYVASVLVTILPTYVAYNSVVGSEIFFTLLVSSVTYLQLVRTTNKVRYPLLGVLIALATLTKPFFLAYPALFAAWKWIKTKSVKETLLGTLAISLVMVCVFAPWTYRNYLRFDAFIPVTYNGGYVLFLNNNDYNWYGGWIDPHSIKVSDEVKQKFKQVGTVYGEHPPQADTIYKSEAKKWIVSHPIDFAELGVLRLKNTFFSGTDDIRNWTMGPYKKGMATLKKQRHLDTFLSLSSVLMDILSTCGLLYMALLVRDVILSVFRKTRLTDGESQVFLTLLLYVGVYFVTEGQPRYSFPTHYLLVISTVFLLAGFSKRNEDTTPAS